MDSFLRYCTQLEAKDIYSETVVLEKNDTRAILNAIAGEMGGIVMQLDPRQDAPVIQVFSSIEETKDIMKLAVNVGVDKGWKVVLKGKPKFSW